ncbi:30S ribosomal protein S9 [Candidatus Woesearchaeota archaeon]|nr:30S ribosomal protein S9 [Candidatus Woesearchaeota archaeon]
MKIVHMSGKRKKSVARATLREGKGKVRINKVPVETFMPMLSRMKIMEPLTLAGDAVNNIDIDVDVCGGGLSSQAEAARLAIGRALSRYDKKLEKVFLNYDRHLLVADVRRKEPAKPNCHGKARAKRQKSYR